MAVALRDHLYSCAAFVVEDGYWMAVDSASKACDGDDVQCTFDRVYECQVAAACASQERAGRQAEEVELLEQESLCRTGYATGVVLCGACSEGYEVGEDSTCIACPPLWAVMLRISFISLILLAILVLVVRIGQKVSMTQESLVQANDTRDDTASMATITKGTSGIIIGWMQVAAQSLFIFDADCIPELYGEFLGVINVFNLPITEWLAVSCLMDELQTAGVPMPDGGFYFDFYFRAALPFIIATPIFTLGSVKPVEIIRVILGNTARLADLPPVTPGQDMQRSTTSSILGHGREPPTHEDLPSNGAEDAPSRRSEELSPDDLVEDDCSPASPGQSAAKLCGEEQQCGAEAETVEGEPVEGEPVEGKTVDGGEAVDGEPVEGEPVDGKTVEGKTGEGKTMEGEAVDGGKMDGEPVEGEAVDGEPVECKTVDDEAVEGELAPLFENSRMWYPPIAIFLLIFLHPTCGTQMFQVFNCTPVHLHHVDAQQWLELDLRVECFTWQWTLCASVAAFVILTYILGLPIILAMIVWRLSSYRRVALPGGEVFFAPQGWLDGEGEPGDGAGEGLDSDAPLPKVADEEEEERTLLDHRRVRGSLGVLYAPFKRRFFWFTSYDMVRRLVQTSAVLVVRLINPDLDLYYALLVSVVFLALQAHLSPYDADDDNLVQMLVLLNHCVVLITLLYTRDSGHGTSGADVALVGTQVALSMYILRVLIRQYPHLWGYLFNCLTAILRQTPSLWRRGCCGCQKGGIQAKQDTTIRWRSNILRDDPRGECSKECMHR
ncbi:hypothetical protein CYMTET_50741 [Cymbomonas tetramitiformis]|uniref:TRP C-terminal domain-containing protein n=1 Tax=Cymbomonas tetramitiformis TaxID=36881 RepID=A0AAE0BNL5_9CHLO|nr:hypothetical protein CYMTET_50741 [Cymbomonas tetramitiformis]